MEECVKYVMDEVCINNENEAFLVAGAIPSANPPLNNRVNIPETLWTAFCCYNNVTKKWLAGAHWGDNVPESESKSEVLKMVTKTLTELNTALKIEPFPIDKCRRHAEVSQLYSKFTELKSCPKLSIFRWFLNKKYDFVQYIYSWILWDEDST